MRFIKTFVVSVAQIFLLLTFLLVIALIYLQFRPIWLTPIAPLVERAIGGEVRLVNPRLHWSSQHNGVAFTAERVFHHGDGVVITATDIYVRHNLTALWLNGRIALASLRVGGVEIHARDNHTLRSRLTQMAIALPQFSSGDGFRYINDIAVGGIIFTQNGEPAPPPSNFSLRREKNILTAQANIILPRHDAHQTSFLAAGRIEVGQGGQIVANINDIHTTDIADIGQGFAPFRTIDASGNATAILRIDKNLRPTIGEIDMNIGKGEVRFPFAQPKFLAERVFQLHSAHLVGDVDFTDRIAARSLNIREAAVSIDESNININGKVSYQLSSDGLAVRGEVLGGTAHINMQELFVAPLKLQSINADARYDYGKNIFTISHLSGDDPRGDNVAVLAGKLDGQQSPPRLTIDLDIGGTDSATALQLWTPLVAPKARKWAVENISAGRVASAKLKMDIDIETLLNKPKRQPLPEDAVHLRLFYEDMSLRYVDALPPLINARGVMDVFGKSMRVALASGQVQPPKNKNAFADEPLPTPINIGASSLVLGDIRDPRRPSVLNISAEGESRAVLRYLALPPISATRDIDFDFERLQGEVQGKVELQLPLINKIDRNEIIFNGTATSANAAITEKIDDYFLSDGEISLAINNKFSMQGLAAANSVPLNFIWEIPLQSPDNQRLALSGYIGADEMRALGHADWAHSLERAAYLNLLVEGDITAPDHYRFNIDMTDAIFAPRPLAYTKPQGMDASLSGIITLDKRGNKQNDATGFYTWRTLTFNYKDKNTNPITGLFVFDNGLLESIALPSFTLGLTQDLRLAFSKDASDYRRVDIEASRIHIAPPFESEGGVGVSYGDDAFDYLGERFSLRLATPTLQAGDEVLENVNFLAHHRLTPNTKRGHYEEISSSGSFPAGGLVNVNLTRINEQRRQLFVQSENAGAFLHFLGLSDSVRGGTLRADNVILYNDFRDRAANNLRTHGSATITDFSVRELPLLARIASLAAVSGVPSGLRGDGIPFRKGVIDFKVVGDLLNIENAHFKGSIGITARGDYNTESRAVEMEGTFIPFYRINTALGKVPLLGSIIGQEGLVGFSYQLNGNARDPEINVNPLSALMLGRLRQLFGSDVGLPPAGTETQPPNQ